MRIIEKLPKSFLLTLIAVSLFLFHPISTFSAEKPSQDSAALLDIYHRIEPKLNNNSFGLPLYVESAESADRVNAVVFGIIKHSFGRVRAALKSPENLCNILSLHPNVKACTFSEIPGTTTLTLYAGRKTYQTPEDARRVSYAFSVTEEGTDYLNIILKADEGPLGTKDHELRLEALRLGPETTLIRARYGYSSGPIAQLAENIYFATLGLGKIGFTVSGIDAGGRLQYVRGRRGAIERNAVRYYLAIDSFIDTLPCSEDSCFKTRLSEWYDLADRYKKQLHDMGKADYIGIKEHEHKNQEFLQKK